MLEGVGGSEAAVGIKNVRPVMSPATTQRLVQLSNDLSVSRSAPVSPQGLCRHRAVVIVFSADLCKQWLIMTLTTVFIILLS